MNLDERLRVEASEAFSKVFWTTVNLLYTMVPSSDGIIGTTEMFHDFAERADRFLLAARDATCRDECLDGETMLYFDVWKEVINEVVDDARDVTSGYVFSRSVIERLFLLADEFARGAVGFCIVRRNWHDSIVDRTLN